jgi:hypothetical protein
MSATQLVDGAREQAATAQHRTIPTRLYLSQACRCERTEQHMRVLGGRRTLQVQRCESQSPMQSRRRVGQHVRRGVQQLSPFVCGHLQQGTGGDMLHVL